jgi:hypothetical protein
MSDTETAPIPAETDEQKVATHLDALTRALAGQYGYTHEEVGSAVGGEIVNILGQDGEYLYTLTITRTP